ncbi:MAG: complex I subunit 1 family protein, partial [Pseudomonadota bacterium]
MSKECFVPKLDDKSTYYLAPWIVFIPAMLVFAVIPFGGPLNPSELFSSIPWLAGLFNGQIYPKQIAPLNAGTLAILAISGIGVIGVILAGWSSNNKYSLLGAIRAASQMISYEITLGLSLLPMVLIYNTMDLYEMVEKQSTIIAGIFPKWGLLLSPVCAILYLTAAFAENKRVPFDLPEAESELIAGHFTEYSGMRMGLFMFSEFIEIVVIAAIFVTFFMGGYNLPFMSSTQLQFPGGLTFSLPHWVAALSQPIIFLIKVLIMCCLQILIRWTLPRFRYDQVMRLGWKILIPIGMVNLIITVIYLWIRDNL